MNIMNFSKNIVGKKVIMAFTGVFLFFFVSVHLIGNASVFFGPNGINAYTEKLHSLPALVWSFRLIMIVFFSIHIFLGIQLYLQNRASKAVNYAVKKSLKATFASKNMIWTGSAIAAFLLYHLLHFTIRAISIGQLGLDSMQRPDIYSMVLTGLKEIPSLIIYTLGLTALVLHLFHGIQSLFQSTGISSEAMQSCIIKASRTAAVIIFIGYLAIPIVIVAGILKYW